MIGVLAAVVVLGIAVTVAVSRNEETAPRPDIPLDVWAPYWALEDSVPELPARIGSMREVSPFWFNAVGVDEIAVDPNAPADLAAAFMEEARRSDAAVIPSVVDGLPAGEMAAILSDPELRSEHVDSLVAFAEDGEYDGLDLDYEQFAFADGRSTWATTRPNWVAFIEELASRLHDDGRTLTVSVPPVYDSERTDGSGFWVYDYGAIVDHVDRIRIMAYDFSVAEPGPIAPIDWVETAVVGALEATDRPDKLVLGVPSYGRNWPRATTGECPASGAPGRTSVTARTVDDLVQRRGATPVYVEETAEYMFEYPLEVSDESTTCVQTRTVHYVDGDGVRARMDLARKYHLDGVSLWALGFEDDAVWEAILPTVADPTPATFPSSDR